MRNRRPRGSEGGRPGGWAPIVAYGLVAAATQMLWLTYAPITTDAAHRYGVSVAAIGWLSEIFPLLYVLLAIPAGILLDRFFVPSLIGGGMLVALGGLLRLGALDYGWAMAGQALVAIAQPLVMSAVGKIAGECLPPAERPAGIAAGSAASFVGMLLALLLGPALGASHLELLLAIEAAAATAVALWMALVLLRPGALREAAPEAGGAGDPLQRAAIERGAARELWRLPSIRILSALSFLGFGAFVALSTWLQTLLHPSGISDTAAGVLLVVMILAGIVGCAVLPPLVERNRAERGFMRAVVLVGCLGSIALGVLPGVLGRGVAMIAMGALLLPALPVIMTLAERIAGPAAGTAGAIVWLAGNLGGLVVALIVQALIHSPLAAFLALAAVIILGLPFAGRVAGMARAIEIAPEPADRSPAVAG